MASQGAGSVFALPRCQRMALAGIVVETRGNDADRLKPGLRTGRHIGNTLAVDRERCGSIAAVGSVGAGQRVWALVALPQRRYFDHDVAQRLVAGSADHDLERDVLPPCGGEFDGLAVVEPVVLPEAVRLRPLRETFEEAACHGADADGGRQYAKCPFG